MGLFAYRMSVLSNCVASTLLLYLDLRNYHFSRHGIAHPAAQRQQGNQKGDEQVAHGNFRYQKFLVVYFYTAMLVAMVSEKLVYSEPSGLTSKSFPAARKWSQGHL